MTHKNFNTFYPLVSFWVADVAVSKGTRSLSGPTLAAVQSWNQASVMSSGELLPVPWYCLQPPIPGDVLHVHDTGWGAVPEIFKATAATRWQMQLLQKESHGLQPRSDGSDGLQISEQTWNSLVTLKFVHRLPEDEVLAVPHCFQLESQDVQWHLVALVCQDHRHLKSNSTCIEEGLHSMPKPHRVTFLHGAKEWLLENGCLQELRRRSLPSSMPNSWLCTRSLSPEVIVYMKGRPRGSLYTAKSEGIPASLADRTAFRVRIVTEKAEQRSVVLVKHIWLCSLSPDSWKLLYINFGSVFFEDFDHNCWPPHWNLALKAPPP